MSRRTPPGPAPPSKHSRGRPDVKSLGRRQRPGGHGFSWWPYGSLLALAVLVGLFVVTRSMGPSERAGSQQSGASQSQSERGLAVGANVPNLSLQGTNGQPVSLEQMRGSKVVVYFYETSG